MFYVIAKSGVVYGGSTHEENFFVIDRELFELWFDGDLEMAVPDGPYIAEVVDEFPSWNEAVQCCDRLYADLDRIV
jgi:hypothetical protein